MECLGGVVEAATDEGLGMGRVREKAGFPRGSSG